MKTRPVEQIQRAHDMLTAIALKEVPNPLPVSFEGSAMHAALDVLCWVFEHDHNKTFAGNISRIEERLAQSGYILENKGN